MSRADATRARILSAATDEFAEHGIAGARVDRIAAAATANKNLIYVYFDNKERLFDTVFEAHVAHGLDEVAFTTDDLPGYAVHLHDYYRRHPQVARLAMWHRLERGDDEAAAAVPAYQTKLAALADAQRAGLVGTTFPPAALLRLILAIATVWTPVGVTAAPPTTARSPKQSEARQAIRDAVTRLL